MPVLLRRACLSTQHSNNNNNNNKNQNSSVSSSSNSSSNNSHSSSVSHSSSDSVKGPSSRSRLRQLFRDYGMVAVGVHLTVALSTLGAFYVAIRSGVDVSDLERFGIRVQLDTVGQQLTTFTLAYVAYKTTAVVRIPITLALTPFVAHKFFRRGVPAASAGAGDIPLDTFAVVTSQPGTGSSPKAGDVVEVHYTGYLLPSGTIFDSSVTRGQSFRFVVGQGSVIRGWDEGLLRMREGEKATLVCPPDYAYGPAGAPPVIPPNTTISFEVELLRVHSAVTA